MGNERHRRVWPPPDACHTITIRVNTAQLWAWQRLAERLAISVPVYVALAATRYGTALDKRRRQRRRRKDRGQTTGRV